MLLHISSDVVHKFIRDLYYKRFPELESLVQLPLEYVKTVKVINVHLWWTCEQKVGKVPIGLSQYVTQSWTSWTFLIQK